MKNCASLILWIISGSVQGLAAQPVSLDSAASAAIDRYVATEMKERQIPGLALAVCYRGRS